MRPEFSEFSFGYALTEALVNGQQHIVRPTFPTQRQERSVGYDLRLDRPGSPIFLQFKLCQGMTRRSAREYAYHGLPLDFPFLRMPLMPSRLSPQHDRLLKLESRGETVYYAAPRFFRDDDFAAHYGNQGILSHSAFIRPGAIGALPDDTDHHVSFDCDARHGWFLSEPAPIEPILDGEGFSVDMRLRLHDEGRLSDQVKFALLRLTSTTVDDALERRGSFAARGILRRMCLDIRQVHRDFPTWEAILDNSMRMGQQVTSVSPDQWSGIFHRELQTRLEATDAPEDNVHLLGALAQLYCDSTVILVSQTDGD